MRDLVYFIAASVDGFIAGPDGDTSGFPVTPAGLDSLFQIYPETCPTHLREHFRVTSSPVRFDTCVMGYRTFEPALTAGLTSAYPHMRQLVATHKELPGNTEVEVLNGDLPTRIQELKREHGKDIWLCGGADLAAQLIDQVDEIQVKINPLLLGDGIPLTRLSPATRPLELTESRVLPSGIVLNSYRPLKQTSSVS